MKRKPRKLAPPKKLSKMQRLVRALRNVPSTAIRRQREQGINAEQGITIEDFAVAIEKEFDL